MTKTKDSTPQPLARPWHSPADVDRARREFFELTRWPAELISERILRSWRRCLEMGLAPDRLAAPPAPQPTAVEAGRRRCEQLLAYAAPEIESLHDSLEDSDSLVLLAAPDGTLLDARGAGRTMQRTARVALLPGVCWSEAQRGTNAIGTALADNHLVEVWGGEHFHERHRILCCTAAPVLDTTGILAGVVNVSGDSRLPRGYARAAVKRAVREIEHRWLIDAPGRYARLRFHPQQALLGSFQEGVLLLDDDRIVGANRAALRWLGADWDIIGRDWRQCFAAPLPAAGVTAFAPYEGGTIVLMAELQPALRAARRPAGNAPAGAAAATWFSPAVRAKLDRARRTANAGLTTMILGETGTGKEMFARALHRASVRRDGPFVAINCAALPETLIEAELFGYAAGAFTGARRQGAPGRILEADGGMLFLDEIGDMPMSLQTRLLRVLQEHEVAPLGGGAARPVDCVVICATLRDLGAMVAAGLFRTDLFYRLQHFVVRLPPWRELPQAEREQALDALWQRTVAPARRQRLAAAARQLLLAHDWPGNLRQCANTLAALAALHDDGATIGSEHLPEDVVQAEPGRRPLPAASGTLLSEVTRAAIEQALARHGGRVAAAADELGIHRATLYRQARHYGIGLGLRRRSRRAAGAD